MKAGLLVACVALVLAATGSASRLDETHILNPYTSFTTQAKLDKELDVTMSGTFTITSKNPVAGEKPCNYDAFYVWGCLPKPNWPGTIYVGLEAENYNPTQIRRLYNPQSGDPAPPPYNASHRYSFKIHCAFHSSGCGRVRFYGGYGTPPTDKVIRGSMTVEVDDSTPSSVRMDFAVIVRGKPNIPIRGSTSGTLIGARLTGSGHVTFEKRSGALLVGTESKGTVVLEEVLPGGKRWRIEYGIITGTRGRALGSTYAPETGRLALLLKVKSSEDPRCPESGLLTPTLAGLTLIPAAGVRDQVVLAGAAATSLTNACKGHTHAWQGGSGGVIVALRIQRG